MAQTIRYMPLHWREAGPSTGPVLLLVHGFPFNSEMWAPQLESPPAGWRVIAPDLRGFGESPAIGAEPLTMDAFADDLAGLLQHLGVRSAVVCGLSMGGYVTFALVRKFPHLARALILCDTRPEPDAEEVRRGRLQSAARVSADGTAHVVDGMLPRVLAPMTPFRAPEVRDQIRRIMEAAPQATVAAALRAMAARGDSSPMLRDLNIPVQVIVGVEDQITPVGEAQLMARAIRGSNLTIIPDAGHVPNLENPVAFNSVVETFLGSLPVA
jgi:pimeloyl-ACP methyl ester carboxylesterase